MATFHKYKKKGSNKDFWEYRIYYQDPITRKTREKSKKGFATKPEAKLAAEEMERMIREGVYFTNESLMSYLKTWLNEYKKGTIAKSTYESHEQNIRIRISPFFKNILLKDVNPILYQKFINHLSDQGYSKQTVKLVHQTMYNAFEKLSSLARFQRIHVSVLN